MSALAAGAQRILRSRRVVTPEGERPGCLVVREGRIAALLPWEADVAITDELGERALLPGLVDTHVHVNDPGRSDWEGFRTATRAAAAGGITTIVDMPLNSIPATTTAAALRAKVAAMAGQLHVDAGLWGGVVPGNAAELAPLAAAGALGFKCFLSPSGVDEFPNVGEADLCTALPALAALGLPLLAHAEDPAQLLALPGSTRRYADWLASRPPAAEAEAIGMLARLALESGVHVHVVHVASSAAVAALVAGRTALRGSAGARGRLTAETCPHYLFFAAGEIADGDTRFKCAPPIRDAGERLALRRALLGHELELVASDHSPAPGALKDLAGGDFARAWGGIASLEFSLSATWTAMRDTGASLRDLARWMSREPAKLAGLGARKGAIAPGFDADLVAFDSQVHWTPVAAVQQRHPLTPYAGRPLRGRVFGTWLRGERVYDGAEPCGAPAGLWQRNGAEPVDPARAFA